MHKHLATQAVIEDLKKLHEGVRMTLELLTGKQNYREAERILLIVHEHTVRLINSTKAAR